MELKTTLLTTISFLSLIAANAQYTPYITEDFSSNKNAWKVSEKKPYFALLHNQYHIYNDEGKQPVVSVMDVPLDEDMDYKIEARLKQSYTPNKEVGQYGIFFGGFDDKNGYVFALRSYGGFTIMKMTNGKLAEMKGGSCYTLDENATFYNGEKITLLLENLNWEFFVNDSFVYSCLPIASLGPKTGFYVSLYSGMIVTEGFYIDESEPIDNPCPLGFSQEEFSAALSPLICHADEDFAEEIGEEASSVTDYRLWDVKDMSFPDVKDMFIAHNETKDNDKKGKDMILMFYCEDGTDLTHANIYFESMRKAIDLVRPDCVELKPDEVVVNVRDDLLKATSWKGDITTDHGKVKVRVELDINLIGEKYYVVMHINLPK